MLASALARCLSFAALGAICGCTAPSSEDTVSPSGGRDEPTGEARSALGTFAWTHAASMGNGHSFISAVPLEDGRVFVTGYGGQQAPSEIYDSWTDTWTAVAACPQDNFYPLAARLPDHRVLAVDWSGHHTAYIYDVDLDIWNQIEDPTPEAIFQLVPLLDGRVFLVGADETGVEQLSTPNFAVFDPINLTFESVTAPSTSYHPTATRLLDGRVLLTGGWASDFGLPADDLNIFDPMTGTIEPVGNLPEERAVHNAVLLPESGEVLLFGGVTQEGKTITTRLYDPTSGTWTAVVDGVNESDLQEGISTYMPALGRVIVTSGDEGHVVTFDPISMRWEAAAPMLVPRLGHELVLLPQGWLLAVGGFADVNLSSTEIFGPLGTPCVSAGDCGEGAYCTDGVCCATACDGVCESCVGAESLGRCKWQPPGQDLRGQCDQGCDGVCNGTGQCVFTPVGEPCGPSQCSEDAAHLLVPAVCGEDRTCVEPSPSLMDCAPYRCGPVDGRPACKTQCDSLSDCAPGHVCDLQGHCVPPPPPETRASCSAAPPSGGKGPTGLWAAGLFALVALVRRRAKRRYGAAALLVSMLGLSACAAPGITKEDSGPRPRRSQGEPPAPADAAWYPVAAPPVPRHKATLLTLPDASVLAIGGCEVLNCSPSPWVDRFDVVANQWRPEPELPSLTMDTRAVLLDDGRVLVSGGRILDDMDSMVGAVGDAAIRDPETGVWTSVPMQHRRVHPAMARLPDGRVLVAGGQLASGEPAESTELFDPTSGAWSPAPPMLQMCWSANGVLLGGDFLVIGECYSDGALVPEREIQRFDPASQTWSLLPPLPDTVSLSGGVALPDGRLFVVGTLGEVWLEKKCFAAIFNPAGSTWTLVDVDDTLPFDLKPTLLPGGRVLLIAAHYYQDTWLFDPATNTIIPAASMLAEHPFPSTALIPGHGILLYDGLVPELYTDLGSPCTAGADCLTTICAVGACCSPGCECGICSPIGCGNVAAPEKKGLTVCEPGCVGPTRERRPAPCDIYSPECLYEETDCVAYQCDPAAGGCRTSCDGPADCAEGFMCTVERRCVAPPTPISAASCSAAPRPFEEASSALLATFALTAARALRRRRGVRRGAARE